MNTYQQPLIRNYWAKGYPSSLFIQAFAVYLSVAISFYFSFGGTETVDLWHEKIPRVTQVAYEYNGYYALEIKALASDSKTQQMLYTNIPGLNKVTTAGVTADPQPLTVVQNDDSITIQFSYNLANSFQPLSVNAMVFLNVSFPQLGQSLHNFIPIHIPSAATHYQAQGVLSYEYDPSVKTTKLNSKPILNYPMHFPSFRIPKTISKILQGVLNGQVSPLRIDKIQRIFYGMKQDKSYIIGTTKVSCNIMLTKQRTIFVEIQRSLLETLKFIFSRWLAFGLIVWTIVRYILLTMIKQGILSVYMTTGP